MYKVMSIYPCCNTHIAVQNWKINSNVCSTYSATKKDTLKHEALVWIEKSSERQEMLEGSKLAAYFPSRGKSYPTFGYIGKPRKE